MPVFFCRWPNGGFSVVDASNKDHAVELLDEVGNADDALLVTMKEFMVHFELTDEGDFNFELFGDATVERIRQLGYPLLEALDSDDLNALKLAVTMERARVLVPTRKQPRTLLAKKLNPFFDMPRKMADRIAKEATIASVKNFKKRAKSILR